MPVKPLNLDELTSKAENVYEAIVILLKRARQINEEMKIEFNQRIEMLQSRIFEPEEETDQPQTNPDQILVAQEFEKRPKPTETSVQELMEGNLAYRYKEEDPAPAPPAS